MNAYFIITQNEQPTYDAPPEVSWGLPTGRDYFCDLVFAETRGKARAIFAKEYLDGWFTEPVHIKLVTKNVSRIRGIAECDDILHVYVHPASWASSDDFDLLADLIINHYRDYPVEG